MFPFPFDWVDLMDRPKTRIGQMCSYAVGLIEVIMELRWTESKENLNDFAHASMA